LKEAQQFYWQLTIYETVPQREVTLNVGKYIVIYPRSKYPDVLNVPRKITENYLKVPIFNVLFYLLQTNSFTKLIAVSIYEMKAATAQAFSLYESVERI
jgi:hypothetical protein